MCNTATARRFVALCLLITLVVPGSAPWASAASANVLPGRDGATGGGSLPTSPAAPQAIWTADPIFSAAWDSDYVALDVDSVDELHAVFFNAGTNGLNYAHRTGGAWQISQIASFLAHTPVDLALDAADNPRSVYVDLYWQLHYAYLEGSQWQDETIAEAFKPTLAVDSSGAPHVSYWDPISQTVMYGSRTETGWTLEPVSVVATYDPYPSLALDSQDRPHLCYATDTGTLAYSTFDGSSWVHEVIDPEGVEAGDECSLALDAGDNPQVSYHTATTDQDGYLMYARRTASGWAPEMLDDGFVENGSISLAIDSAGLPAISFTNRGIGVTGVYYQHYDGEAWQTEFIVDAVPKVTSLALSSTGQAYAAFAVAWYYYLATRIATGTLSGRVLQSTPAGYLPAPDASVAASYDQFTWTDTNGDYTLDVTAGTYDVAFAKPDYITITKTNALVNENQVTTVNATLIPAECWPPEQSCFNELVNIIPILGTSSEASGFWNSLCEFTNRRAEGDDLGALTVLLPSLVDIVDIPGIGDAIDVLEGFVTCLEGLIYDTLELICGPYSSFCKQTFSRMLWRSAGPGANALIILIELLPDGAAAPRSPGSPGAVEVHVYGDNGHLGLVDGHVEHTLPTSYLFRAGGTYQIAILKGVSEPDELEVHGLSAGSYRLIVVNPQSEGTGSLVTYEAVPTTGGAVASILLGPDTTDFTLALDQDGNGSIDDYQLPDAVETVWPVAVYLPLVLRHDR